MEKEPVTAKELKEAAEILGTHTRDLLNSNINLRIRFLTSSDCATPS